MTQILRVKCHSMSPNQRRQIIGETILYQTIEKIAHSCGVSKRTILRDIKKWKEEGGFEELLLDEFLHSYPVIKKAFPEKAFDRLCYLLGKTVTQKREIKEDVTEKQLVIIKVWNEDADSGSGNKV